MVIKNLKIVTPNEVIPNGYLVFDATIQEIGKGPYLGSEEAIDGLGKIAMPGFIDIHVHGSAGIDFMDAKEEDYAPVAESLYQEGVTTFLATTLTSDFASLERVCQTVAKAKEKVPSLGGIHLEGPYISEKYKGAQNPEYIRNPDLNEWNSLQTAAKGSIRYITLAPELDGATEFIQELSQQGVTVSAGHSDATFEQIESAIDKGLRNITHTHNAMSPHHHRHPGIVTAAMYFDSLFTEVICDKVHVCPETLKTFYKIVGPDRFIAITDALKIKHTSIREFQLAGLDCIVKPDAAYLKSGPLAGSLLSMDQALRNLKEITHASLCDLAKMTSTNAARSIGLHQCGSLEKGKQADLVLLDENLYVQDVYKAGKKVR